VNAAGIAERVRTSFPDVIVARNEASVIVGRDDCWGHSDRSAMTPSCDWTSSRA
jgi:hypothetical protein